MAQAGRFKVGTAVVTYVAPTTTYAQAFTGFGFQPKAILFWIGSFNPGVNDTQPSGIPSMYDGWRFGHGFTDGTTSFACTRTVNDNDSQPGVGQKHSNSLVVLVSTQTGVDRLTGSLTSLDADGFTVQWTVTSALTGEYHVHYLAIGGTGVSAKVAKVFTPAATGNFSVTGTGFQPTALFFVGQHNDVANANNNHTTGMGFTDGVRQALSLVGDSYAITGAPQQTYRYQRTNKCLGALGYTDKSILYEASIVSMDADGFTVNFSTAAFHQLYYLALNIDAYVGSVIQPTTAGTQLVTGPSFWAGALLMQGVSNTVQSTARDEHRYTLGVTDGTTHALAAVGTLDVGRFNGVNLWFSETAYYRSATLLAASLTPADTGASSTLDATASLLSRTNSGPFTLQWSTVNGAANEWAYLALSGTSTGTACEGGGTIAVVADPASGEVFTGRTQNPRAMLTLVYDDANRYFALDSSNRPTQRAVGSLTWFGSVLRQLSDRFSSYKRGTLTVDDDDTSRLLSTLEATAASQHWANREAKLELASAATIAAGGTPHTRFRGIWTGHTSRGLQRSLTFSDILGSDFSDLNIEGTIPKRVLTRALIIALGIPVPNESAIDQVVPILYGRISDEQLTTVTGSSLTLEFDPTISNAGSYYVNSIPGSVAYQYDNPAGTPVWAQLVAVRNNKGGPPITNAYGQTLSSTQPWLFGNPPDPLSASGLALSFPQGVNNDAWSFRAFFADAADFNPYGSRGSATRVRYIDHDITTLDGIYDATLSSIPFANWSDGTDAFGVATSVTVDSGKGVYAPRYLGVAASIGGRRRHTWIVAGHACQDIHGLFIEGVKIDLDSSGWLVPGQAPWTAVFGATTYRDIGGSRYTFIYGDEGNPVADRAAGVIPRIDTTTVPAPPLIAINLCGLEDLSDGTGNTITAAPRQVYHLLEQWVLQNYLTGTWASVANAADGTPWLNSASFAALEAVEIARVGGEGYLGTIIIDQPLTVRELLGRILTSFDMRFGQNQHGQVIAKHLDDRTDLTTTAQITDVRDLVDATEIDRRLTELENTVILDWKWRQATQAFDEVGLKLKDDLAIGTLSPPTGNRGRVAVGDRRQLYYVRDEATATDVGGRALAIGKYPPRYFTATCTLHSFSVQLGDIVRFTDVDGIGATGWTNRPGFVIGIEDQIGDLETPPVVKLTCLDVDRFFNVTGVMGDRTVLVNWSTETAANKLAYYYMADRTSGTFADGSPAKEMR